MQTVMVDFKELMYDLRNFSKKCKHFGGDMNYVTLDSEDEIVKQRISQDRFMSREGTPLVVSKISLIRKNHPDTISYKMFNLKDFVLSEIIVSEKTWKNSGEFIIIVTAQKPHHSILVCKKVPNEMPFISGSSVITFRLTKNSTIYETLRKSKNSRDQNYALQSAEIFRLYLNSLANNVPLCY